MSNFWFQCIFKAKTDIAISQFKLDFGEMRALGAYCFPPQRAAIVLTTIAGEAEAACEISEVWIMIIDSIEGIRSSEFQCSKAVLRMIGHVMSKTMVG